jgi:hypothetical protein
MTTTIANKRFELPLALLIGLLCLPAGFWVIMYPVSRLARHLGMGPHAPHTATPFEAVVILDVVVLGLLGILPFIAALGLWLVLLIAGRSRTAKFFTFLCLLFAIGGLLIVRSMGSR